MSAFSAFSFADSTKWLVLPRMDVRSMNAQPAWWCVGAPGPMAACGLAHALSNCFGGAQNLKGVAMIWHHFELRGEYIRSGPSSSFQDFHAHQHRAAALINDNDYASGSKTLAGQPTVRGDGTITLILALDGMASVDIEAIEQRLNTGRLAGGSIVDHQFRVPHSDRARASSRHQLVYEEWGGVMARVRSGYAFVDRSELVQEAIAQGAKDPLDAFLQCTQPESKESRSKKRKANVKYVLPRSAWLAPYLAGYYGLTPAQPRRMARDGHPHAFVEPLIGLGQFLSIRSSGAIPFWNYTTDASGIYRVIETNCFGGTKPAAKAYEQRATAESTAGESHVKQ